MSEISVIIRTLNESKYLAALLNSIREQNEIMETEVVIVDSGSNDNTLEIAESFNCKIIHINKKEFSFGRALNYGCDSASGKYLVFVSGHCIPVNSSWLVNLIKPLKSGKAHYVYGRQIGNSTNKFSERQLYKKYYPDSNETNNEEYFANNANAALIREVWEKYKFDEDLTGLEDMAMGKDLVTNNLVIGYQKDALVYHIHEETWGQIQRRYEREAIALQKIMPQIHMSFGDFLRYYISAVFLDFGCAIEEKCLLDVFYEILIFRLMQFWGGYKGNHEHRKLSREMKEKYFYPKH